MANSETLDRLYSVVKAKGYSDPYPFIAGVLGVLADEAELLKTVEHMEREVRNA